MNRIDNAFKVLKKNKKKAFIAFVTSGYPSLNITEKLILALDKSKVDVIELGVPFSDPMADGPVIQEASFEALKHNTRLVDILQLVKKLRTKVNAPLLLMTYYNPIFSYGDDKFIRKAKESGLDGVIIPDLPFDEGRDFIIKANKAGLYNISFVSPTTSASRIKLICKIARGFIYYLSLTGVTGMRRVLPYGIKRNIGIIKKHTSLPVCVGFGVSSRTQVEKILKYADGVIVGSAIVSEIKKNINSPLLVKRVEGFVKRLNNK